MQLLSTILLYLTKHLYPSGRAFRIPVGSFIEKVHKGLIVSEQEAYQECVGLLDSILADNQNFTSKNASEWERRLGLSIDPTISIDDRKLAIQRKYASPGNAPYRQHYLYLEGQLQSAGFDVYVHENRQPNGSGGYETIDINTISEQYGYDQYGYDQYGPSAGSLEKVHDSISDNTFDLPEDRRATFFICGEILGEIADVPLLRKNEFRQLILNIKPCQTIALLIINYN